VTELKFIENDKIIRMTLKQRMQFSYVDVTVGGNAEIN